MAARKRSNSLALAILVCLWERPMHPYDIATTLRQRHKDRAVKLNYGSLYGTVESLAKRGLIEVAGVSREGRLPERTVYQLTPAGRSETEDWLSELLSTPVHEYPAFNAALSFLGVLPPERVSALLTERLLALEVAVASSHAVREVVEKRGLPRLFWVEEEYLLALMEAEIRFVEGLRSSIDDRSLEGMGFWEQIHADGPPPEIPAAWTGQEDHLWGQPAGGSPSDAETPASPADRQPTDAPEERSTDAPEERKTDAPEERKEETE